MHNFTCSLFFLISIAMTVHYAEAQGLPPTPPPPPGATPPPPPPPPPPAQQLKVYFSVNGQVFGPFNKEQLTAKISAGEINRQTLVWTEGMAEWQAAATVPTVAPLLTAVPPEPKFDASGYMAGTWETSAPGYFPDGTQYHGSSTITYRADGSLTGFGKLTAQTQYGPFIINNSMKGTWKVEPKTDNSFILTTNITVTATSGSQLPRTEIVNDSNLYTVLDRNTLADPNGRRAYRVGN
ncbi:MAG: DUF4339 domain-containing protein [Paracoccaceae bacterium]